MSFLLRVPHNASRIALAIQAHSRVTPRLWDLLRHLHSVTSAVHEVHPRSHGLTRAVHPVVVNGLHREIHRAG